jgi:cytosine/adenosine deaminase-related metal-dependent hydrolase
VVTFLEPGDPLDAAVVDGLDPTWESMPVRCRVSARIFAPSARPLLGTLIGGRWVARNGRHLKEEPVAKEAQKALRSLRETASKPD